jgi:hypothetical protein
MFPKLDPTAKSNQGILKISRTDTDRKVEAKSSTPKKPIQKLDSQIQSKHDGSIQFSGSLFGVRKRESHSGDDYPDLPWGPVHK